MKRRRCRADLAEVWTTGLLFLLGGFAIAGGLVLFHRSSAEPTSDSL